MLTVKSIKAAVLPVAPCPMEARMLPGLKFPVVDTDALPHVVHLIRMELESAERAQALVNTES